MRALGCEPKKVPRRVWKSVAQSGWPLPEPGMLGWSLHAVPWPGWSLHALPWPVPSVALAAGSALQRQPSVAGSYEPLGRHSWRRPPPSSRQLQRPVAPLPRVRATCLRPARCPLDAARQEDMKKLLGEVDKDNTGTVDFEGYLQARAAARRAGGVQGGEEAGRLA